MHLGIIVPEGDVCLQLEDQNLRWEEGKVMIFDDFYPHAAWNKSAATRVILMVDFLRPMPKWKLAVIQFMHRMNARSLPNIPAHWLNW
jgi:aspartyl/asparaginyl beta-hydroxylase (cupin superfamily)